MNSCMFQYKKYFSLRKLVWLTFGYYNLLQHLGIAKLNSSKFLIKQRCKPLCPLGYKIKLWMINEKKEAVFGDGLAELLEEINKYHSILAAAEHLDMSYRYALHRITLAEERLGQLLVIRVRGGANGGGSSEVTDLGKDLVKRYRNAQTKLNKVLKKMP